MFSQIEDVWKRMEEYKVIRARGGGGGVTRRK